jgi:phosphatidyl-myo-inositol alpha-mannosyltransferase
MRILHIDPDDVDNPMSGGGPQRTLNIYSRLSSRHEITVLTPTFAGSTPETFRDGVRYVRLGRKIGDHKSSHHITFYFALPAALRRFEYDLVVEDFMPPASATLNPLFSRTPHIASVQWFSAETLSRQYHLPFFLGERYGLRLYRHFVVLTDDMRRRIQGRHPAANCARVPNGVAADLFDTPIRIGDFVLFLGLVNTRIKGVDLLLRAFARIPAAKRRPLVLAGHGFEWSEVQRLISQLDLADWVTVRGRVDHRERRRLFESCRFVCVPSREETFGMVIAESCAAGKPVVLFDRAPMNEVASPGCERVPPFDVEAYSQAMRRLLEATPEELARRGDASRSGARRFSWDAVAAQQEAFYAEVVSGRPS